MWLGWNMAKLIRANHVICHKTVGTLEERIERLETENERLRSRLAEFEADRRHDEFGAQGISDLGNICGY